MTATLTWVHPTPHTVQVASDELPAAGAGKVIRVLLIDDHPIVRHGIASLLDVEADIKVVATARSGEEGVTMFRKHRPDVAVVDLRLPGISGVDTIRILRSEFPDAHCIVLTTYDGDEDIHRALAAGALAYLLKDTFCDEIVETIRAAHAGQTRIPAAVAERLAERPTTGSLTARELEVLRRMARGESNKEIGAALGIVEGTVKIHVGKILEKMGVDDRTAAAMSAVQRGLIRL